MTQSTVDGVTFGTWRTCGLGRAECDLARCPARGRIRRLLPAAPWESRYCPFLAQVRLGRSHRVYQPHRGRRLPARATPAEAITGAAHEASESGDWGCIDHPGPARHRA